MTLQSFSTYANHTIMNTLRLLFFTLLTLFLSTCDSDVATFQPDHTLQAVVLDENNQPIRDASVAYLPVLVQPFSSTLSSLTATLDTTVIFTNDTITIRAKALSPGTLSVTLSEQQPTPPVSGQSPTDIGVMRISHYYWTIQPDANLSISHVTIDVRYSLPFLNISEPTYVVWLHRDSSGGDWKVLPTAVVGNQLRGTLPPNPFGEVALAALPQDIICFPSPIAFTATPTAEGIRLNWETRWEHNLAGFQVIRNGELLADYQRESALRSEGLIIVIGRPYAFIDATAQPNQTYTYQLRSISTLGYVENLFPTLTATPMRNADASSLRISQIFPSPLLTNGLTYGLLVYTVPSQSDVKIELLDVSSRTVIKTINDSTRTAGSYVVKFDGSLLPTGIITARLIAGGKAVERRMVVLNNQGFSSISGRTPFRMTDSEGRFKAQYSELGIGEAFDAFDNLGSSGTSFTVSDSATFWIFKSGYQPLKSTVKLDRNRNTEVVFRLSQTASSN